MFNKEDIVARLKNGETIDDIADELAAVLNASMKQIEDEKAAKEQEEAKEKARIEREAQLDSLADIVVDSMKNYVIIYDPSLADVVNDSDICGTIFRETIDSLIPMLKFSASIEKLAKASLMNEKNIKGIKEKEVDVETILKNWIDDLK